MKIIEIMCQNLSQNVYYILLYIPILTKTPQMQKNDVQKMLENLPHNVEHSGHP